MNKKKNQETMTKAVMFDCSKLMMFLSIYWDFSLLTVVVVEVVVVVHVMFVIVNVYVDEMS